MGRPGLLSYAAPALIGKSWHKKRGSRVIIVQALKDDRWFWFSEPGFLVNECHSIPPAHVAGPGLFPFPACQQIDS